MTQTILDVRGIGPAIQTVLAKQGFVTLDDLANTTVKMLIVTPGISEIKATQVIADARNIIATGSVGKNLNSTKMKDNVKDKKSKKNKKDKKDKKDKKEKKDKKGKLSPSPTYQFLLLFLAHGLQFIFRQEK